MASLPTTVNKENFKAFLDSFDTVLTDCDGVLWQEDNVIGQANVALNALQALGKKVFYVTNNSTKSRDDYVAKCARLNFTASKEAILSSSYVTAQYLKQQGYAGKVYVVGMTGIAKELAEVGITCVGGEPEVYEGGSLGGLVETMTLDPDVGAVVVGFDPHLSYLKVMRAASYLERPGCLFIATNTDERFPVAKKGLVFPGTGCVVRCVETVAERSATVMGKPSTKMFSTIQAKNNLNPQRTLMIGDRCNTDILFGKNCDLLTLVVLSGVTSQSDLDKWSKSSDPNDHKLLADYCLPQLDDLLPFLQTQQELC